MKGRLTALTTGQGRKNSNIKEIGDGQMRIERSQLIQQQADKLIIMGGDTFQGIEKLTNHQFETLVPEILSIIKPMCHKAQVDLPLPEKQLHGDIDFLLILKPTYQAKDLIEALKIERYIISNKDHSINSVYAQNKQVDFCIVECEQQYNTTLFYKAYGGIGAYLGMFVSSKVAKLSTKGLFAVQHHGHIKHELLLTTDVREILEFYGMSYERYQAGFKRRRDFFQYLRTCRLLDEGKFVEINVQSLARNTSRSMGKLAKKFLQYLKEVGPSKQPAKTILENPQQYLLQYFGKKEQFQGEVEGVLMSVKRKQLINGKFNSNHLIDQLGVPFKKVDLIKNQYQNCFESEEKYADFILAHQLQTILEDVRVKCDLKAEIDEDNTENGGDNEKKYHREKRVKKPKMSKKQRMEKRQEGTAKLNQPKQQEEKEQKRISAHLQAE